MDLDALAKKFAKYEPMLEAMLPEFERHKERILERNAEDAAEATAEAFDSGVTDDNRDEIYAPLPGSAPVVDEASRAEADLDAQRLKNDGLTDAELADATAKTGPFGANDQNASQGDQKAAAGTDKPEKPGKPAPQAAQPQSKPAPAKPGADDKAG